MEPIIFNPLNVVLLLGTLIRRPMEKGNVDTCMRVNNRHPLVENLCMGGGRYLNTPNHMRRDRFVLQMLHVMRIYKINNKYYSRFVKDRKETHGSGNLTSFYYLRFSVNIFLGIFTFPIWDSNSCNESND